MHEAIKGLPEAKASKTAISDEVSSRISTAFVGLLRVWGFCCAQRFIWNRVTSYIVKPLPSVSAFLLLFSLILSSQGLSLSEVSVRSYGAINYQISDYARLRINGTKIVNGNGEQVILKGFCVGPNEQRGNPYINEAPFSYEDIQQTKIWGGNVLSFYGIRVEWMMPEKNVIDENYFKNNLDPLAEGCKDLELYCIIGLGEWKWSSYFGQGGGMPEWMFEGKYNKTEADKWQSIRDFWDVNATIQEDNRGYFIDVWKFIANRYKDNPYVLFSIWDEPCGALDHEAYDEVLRFGHSYARFMEEVVDAIRSTGAKQIIIINRPYLWYLSDVRPVNREVVWDNHAYIRGSSDAEWYDDYVKRSADIFIEDFGKPLFWGGFGLYPHSLYNTLDYQTILQNNVKLFNELGFCGYIWLQWGNLYGEYYYKLGYGLTAEQTQDIISIIFA